MRRWLLLCATVVVSGALLLLVFVAVTKGPGRRPESWESALAAYLNYQTDVGGRPLTVTTATQARRPAVMDVTMSEITYGRGMHYAVHVAYETEPAEPSPISATLFPVASKRPVPYPPVEVWCVQLAPTTEDARTDDLILVALHQDLYNAAWIVHQPMPGADLSPLMCTSRSENEGALN